MGAVCLAEHTLFGRRAAIKVLLRELSQRQDLVTRFFNEARAASAVDHPGASVGLPRAFGVMTSLGIQRLHHRRSPRPAGWLDEIDDRSVRRGPAQRRRLVTAGHAAELDVTHAALLLRGARASSVRARSRPAT
jgi:serine/threonine protein kinase